MKQTFEMYLSWLKEKRTEDNYKYTDEDFDKYNDYILNCFNTNLSVYKCLEFMWFETEEAKDTFKNYYKQIDKEVHFNRVNLNK